MNTPTKETDAFASHTRALGTGYYQALDFARNIERQRDALAEALREIIETVSNSDTAYTIAEEALAQLKEGGV
jgi:predicted DNA-binding protein